MSHAFARQFNVSPAEALQEELGRSVGAVRWLDSKIGEAVSDDELLPSGKLGEFVQMRLKERGHLLRVATAGVTVALDERLTALAESQGAVIAGVVNRALAGAALDVDVEDRVREVLARELRAIGS